MNSSEKLQYEPTIADNRNTSLKRPFYIEDTSVMFTASIMVGTQPVRHLKRFNLLKSQ